MLWRERTGHSFQGYSTARWWSNFEVLKQLLDLFGDVKPFFELNTNVSLATHGKLLTMLNDQQQKPYLMVELAVTIDAGMPFVKATYNLEGDGPLALSCYETISALNVSARQASYPNFQPVAIQVSEGNAQLEQQLIQHTKSCVQPGHNYYFHQLTASMKEPLAAFKAARLFSPSKLHEMRPNA